MIGTTKHAALFRVLFMCRIIWLTIIIRANEVVSFESPPSFAFGMQQHPSVVACRKRIQNHDEQKFHRTIKSYFRESSAFRMRNSKRHQEQADDDADVSITTGDVPKYWRTTPSGLRIVDDTVGSGEEWSGEMGMVARVRCQTQILQSSSSIGRKERVVFLESSTTDGSVVLSKDGCGVTLLVVGNENPVLKSNNSTTTTMTKDASLEYSGLQESLIGMRVGGLRRVLIPTTENAFNVRFVGPGAAAVNEETIIMNLRLENLEPPSSLNAIFATTLTSGGPPAAILLLFRPFLSPLGLLSFISFAPLLIKKAINGIAALELYMDVNADTIYPIKTLLEWKLKF